MCLDDLDPYSADLVVGFSVFEVKFVKCLIAGVCDVTRAIHPIRKHAVDETRTCAGKGRRIPWRRERSEKGEAENMPRHGGP